jgi:SEC-C motif-containing protein
MRSRYSAFAVGDAGYLLRTWHPSGRPPELTLDPDLRWTRLAVLETRDGGLFDATGTVQFRAVYVEQGQRGVHAETSSFIRQDGHWTYLGPTDLQGTDSGRNRGAGRADISGMGRVPDQPDHLVAALGQQAFQQERDLPVPARDHYTHAASLLKEAFAWPWTPDHGRTGA